MNRTSLVASAATLLAAGGLVVAASSIDGASAAHRTDRHHLAFTAHTLSSVQSGNTLLEADKLVRAGKTIGYSSNSCAFDFQTHVAHCFVTMARPEGELRMRVTVDGETGRVTGRVAGGTGAYRGAAGTVAGAPAGSQDTVRIVLDWTD